MCYFSPKPQQHSGCFTASVTAPRVPHEASCPKHPFSLKLPNCSSECSPGHSLWFGCSILDVSLEELPILAGSLTLGVCVCGSERTTQPVLLLNQLQSSGPSRPPFIPEPDHSQTSALDPIPALCHIRMTRRGWQAGGGGGVGGVEGGEGSSTEEARLMQRKGVRGSAGDRRRKGEGAPSSSIAGDPGEDWEWRCALPTRRERAPYMELSFWPPIESRGPTSAAVYGARRTLVGFSEGWGGGRQLLPSRVIDLLLVGLMQP